MKTTTQSRVRAGVRGALAGLAVAALVLTGCAADKSKDAGSDGQSSEKQEVTLMLNWTPNSHHAGIYYALKNGLYADKGIDLKIVEPGADMGADKALAQGRAQFGISVAESILPARAEGMDVTAIAAILPENDSALMSIKGTGVTSDLSSLNGKTYGGYGGSLETEILNNLISCGGGDPESLKTVEVGNVDYLAGLDQKRFDTVWVFGGWDVLRAKLERDDVVEIPFSDHKDCVPNWYTPVIATSEKYAAENPEIVKAFMQATSEGYKEVVKNPDAGSDALLEYAPELDEKLVRAATKYYAPKFMKFERFGEMEESVWNDFTDYLVKAGMLKDNSAVKGAWTNEYLQ